MSSVYAALEYAVKLDPKVINLSVTAWDVDTRDLFKPIIDKATSQGISVVGAAGNEGKDAIYTAPGGIDSAIVVGACDESGSKVVSSNWGDTVDYYATGLNTSEAAAKVASLIVTGKDLDESNGVFQFDYSEEQAREDIENVSGEFKPATNSAGYSTVTRFYSSANGYRYWRLSTASSVSGFTKDSMSFKVPNTSASPILESWNPWNPDYNYKVNSYSSGWNQNGRVFYASDDTSVPIYRAYRETTAGMHIFTASLSEYNGLGSEWKRENIVWYGCTPYDQVIQVRYQNADGSWGDYSNVLNSTYASGSTCSWSRAADSTYRAASTSYTVTGAKTTKINVYRNSLPVSFDAGDGTISGTSSFTLQYGSTLTAPTPTKTGYTLASWVPVKFDDPQWVEVLYQEPANAWFGDASGAVAKNAAGAYSMVGQIPKLVRNGKWEYLQTADERAGEYNQWRQTNDITKTTVPADAASAEGFEAVSLSWPSFKGLVNKAANGSTYAAYAASNAGWWWHAVGQYAVYNGGNPWIGDDSFVAKQPIHLYVLSDSTLSNLPSDIDSGISAGGTVYGKLEAQSFKAVWRPNAYTVRYNGSGATGSMANSSFQYNVAGTISDNGFNVPARYTFAGWATSPEHAAAGIVDRNAGDDHGNLSSTDGATVDLYAVWDAIEYGGYDDDEDNTDENHDGYGDNIALSAPTDISFVAKADGDFMTPDNAVIQNHSSFDIRVSSVKAEMGDGWAFTSVEDFATASAKNTLSMTFGPAGEELDITDFLDSKSSVGSSDAWKVSANGQTSVTFTGKAKNITGSADVFGEIHWYVKAAS